MKLSVRYGSVVFALIFVLMDASVSRAQSAIAGVVKDSSGAVLPGVTVEAASPVLIEKVRSVSTDNAGTYKIVDLRPGTYTVTFSLGGFTAVKREGIALPTSFTATVDAELKVGAVEESVTVSGASPVVDVQNTTKNLVLDRELLDAIPTARTAQGAGQLVPGITLNVPDVGGSTALMQSYFSSHSLTGTQTVVMLDGIQFNGMCGDGQVQSYANNQNFEEIVFQTSGAGADVSSGGVRQNMISRRGGNELHGSIATMGSDGSWQSGNLTDQLKARGLTVPNKLSSSYDFEGGVGGKIVRDKLWFFGAGRHISVNPFVADVFYQDGRQGIDDQLVDSAQARLTWQVSPRNQLTVYADRVSKYRGHAMAAGDNPETTSQVWPRSPLYMQSTVKWTSPISNRLLLDIGYVGYQDYRTTKYQEGIDKPYGSADWYASANRNDTSKGTNAVAAAGGSLYVLPVRRYLQGTFAYVTGSHNMKFGVQDNFGNQRFGNHFNADLRQLYQNGAPTSAVIENSPVNYRDDLNADFGLFGQDSWTRKRLTLNYGLRFDYFRTSIPQESSTPGRFIGQRNYAGDVMPIWKSLSPRLGAVYDLFGNAKTALKFSVNKYEQAGTYGVANTYNPIGLTSATVTWRDLNNDDIAENEELTLSQLPRNFGVVPTGCSVVAVTGSTPCGIAQIDPNLKRIYNWQYNVGVQRELLPRVSLNVNWFHVDYYNLPMRENVLQTFADYTPVQIASPLDGSAITMYNVSSAKVSQVLSLDTNAPSRRKWYNSFEVAVNARLPHSATLFAGTATERTLVQACDEQSNPNNLLYCDQTQSGIPWLTSLKVGGTITVPFNLQVSGIFQSYRYTLGSAALTGSYTNSATTSPVGTGPVWLITPTTRYPANCPGACTPGALVDPGMTVASLSVPLQAPGTVFSDRINQLDLTIGRWFTAGGVRFQPEASVFNALNGSAVISVRSLNYLTSSYLQPSSILSARILRIGVQVKF
jgi:hypothetical protein